MSTMSMARSTPAQNPRGAANQSLRVGGVMGSPRTLAQAARPDQSPRARLQRVRVRVTHAVGMEACAQRVRDGRGAERGDALLGARAVGGARVPEPRLAVRGERR